MAAKIQLRHDIAVEWQRVNPILMDGELGLITDDFSSYKMGDGVHHWNELPLRGFAGALVQEIGDSESAVISQKVATKSLNVLNVSLLFPIKDGETYRTIFNDRDEARNAVPVVVRKSGIVLIYQTISEGWIVERNVDDIGGTIASPTTAWSFWETLLGRYIRTTDTNFVSEIVRNLPINTWNNAASKSSYDQETDVFGDKVSALKIVYKDTITEQAIFGISNIDSMMESFAVGAVYTLHLLIYSNKNTDRVRWYFWPHRPLSLLTNNSLKLFKGVNEINVTFRVEEFAGNAANSTALLCFGNNSWAGAELYIHPDSCIYAGGQRNSLGGSSQEVNKGIIVFVGSTVDETTEMLILNKVDNETLILNEVGTSVLGSITKVSQLENDKGYLTGAVRQDNMIFTNE